MKRKIFAILTSALILSTILITTLGGTAFANGAHNHTLEISVHPRDGGYTVPSVGKHSYPSNTEVWVKAFPNFGYEFDEWSGDVSSYRKHDNPVKMVMSENKEITARFDAVSAAVATVDPGTVNVVINADNSVTVSGTVVTVAKAKVNWYGTTEAATAAMYTIDGTTTPMVGSPILEIGGNYSTSDASHTYTWSVRVTEVGDHTAYQTGSASANWHKKYGGSGSASDTKLSPEVFFTVAPPPSGHVAGAISFSPISLAPPAPLPDNTYYVSDRVTASGIVFIEVTAHAEGSSSVEAHASSTAYFTVTDPDSIVIDSGSQHKEASETGGEDKIADADASQIYEWSSTFTLDKEGKYVIVQGGEWETSTSGPGDGDYESGSGSATDSVVVTAVLRPPAQPQTFGVEWQPGISYFVLRVGEYRIYPWTDGPRGNTLPYIEQTGTTRWYGESYQMKVIIPEGTQVTGAHYLSVNYYQGHLILRTIGGPIAFSNAIQIFILQGGNWVQVQ